MLKASHRQTRYRIPVGSENGFDTFDEIRRLRAAGITAHVAQSDSLTKTGAPQRSEPPGSAGSSAH